MVITQAHTHMHITKAHHKYQWHTWAGKQTPCKRVRERMSVCVRVCVWEERVSVLLVFLHALALIERESRKRATLRQCCCCAVCRRLPLLLLCVFFCRVFGLLIQYNNCIKLCVVFSISATLWLCWVCATFLWFFCVNIKYKIQFVID